MLDNEIYKKQLGYSDLAYGPNVSDIDMLLNFPEHLSPIVLLVCKICRNKKKKIPRYFTVYYHS